MAKLCSSYSLCPLIEQRNFLGVSEDSVIGCVIVTLGKNIVIRYKLSDQKQVSSWSSRDKLSAPVVYDSVGKQYIGVFNGDQVAFWEDSFVELNKVKKYKFILLIHCILTAPGIEPVIVFRNGCVASLSIEKRRDPLGDYVIPLEQNIEEAKIINIRGIHYVYLYIKGSEKQWLHFVPVDPDVGAKGVYELERDGLNLVGFTIMDIEVSQLITFWSDGKIFSADLPLEHGENSFLGRFVASIDEISSSLPAAFVPVSPVHVAIYGADSNSEGAMLVIFNIKFGVVQTRSHMKLYSQPPKLWRSGQSELVLVIGQYLAVAPYQLATSRLASLVGAHARPSFLPVVPAVTWSKTQTPIVNGVTHEEISYVKTLLEVLDEMRTKGLTEKAICDEIMPGLLEVKDLGSLKVMLKVSSDVPESWLFSIVRLCMELLPGSRSLLNYALTTHALVQDGSTLSLARSYLDLPLALKLLSELAVSLEMAPHPGLLGWATLLLDSHYQQYLLTRNKDVIETLTKIKTTVNEHLENMKSFQVLGAHILQLKNRKCFVRKAPTSSKSYVVEKIRLY